MIWIAVALITLAAVVLLAAPVLRRPRIVADRAAYDLTVFQDQLKELDRDLARGVLTPQEADAARLEIQRRILAAGRAPAEAVTAGSARARWAAVAVTAAVVPLVALGIYAAVGTPDPERARQVAEGADGALSENDINALVDRLAARVAAEPDNPEGFALLGRTYRELGRFAEAADAYRKLAALQPSAEAYSSLGEALAAMQNGRVQGEAHTALMNALAIDRTDPRARFYLGLEQAATGNARDAIAIWRDLTASAPADAPWLDMVREQMSAAAQNAGIAPMTVEPRHPLDFLPRDEAAMAAVAEAARPQAAPTPAPPASPPSMAGESPENVAMIQGMVAGLAARLEQNPDDFDGWMMLGRSYTVLNQPEQSAEAYRTASALRPKEVAPRLQHAAVLMTGVDPNAQEPLPAELTAVVNEILALEPQQPEALYLAGLGRAKAGDAPGARGFWQRARKAAPDGSALSGEIDRRLRLLP